MTEDQRRYRGDWILRALVDDHRGDIPWRKANPTPPGVRNPTPGMFDPIAGKYDPKAGPSGGFKPPLEATIAVPQLPAIDYPGEDITLTPTLTARIRASFHEHGVHEAFHEYAREGGNYAIVAFWRSQQRVVWTRYPPDDMQRPLRTCVLLASDAIPLAVVNPPAELCEV